MDNSTEYPTENQTLEDKVKENSERSIQTKRKVNVFNGMCCVVYNIQGSSRHV